MIQFTWGIHKEEEKTNCVRNCRKCSATQAPHSDVLPRAFWRLVSKSCDEYKGSFARGFEAKRWSHWTCSSLGTIFQPMRINSVPDVKCFCNNKNVLRAQSMVWHFVLPTSFLQRTINKWITRRRLTSFVVCCTFKATQQISIKYGIARWGMPYTLPKET